MDRAIRTRHCFRQGASSFSKFLPLNFGGQVTPMHEPTEVRLTYASASGVLSPADLRQTLLTYLFDLVASQTFSVATMFKLAHRLTKIS